jgi:hypothetical protein
MLVLCCLCLLETVVTNQHEYAHLQLSRGRLHFCIQNIGIRFRLLSYLSSRLCSAWEPSASFSGVVVVQGLYISGTSLSLILSLAQKANFIRFQPHISISLSVHPRIPDVAVTPRELPHISSPCRM